MINWEAIGAVAESLGAIGVIVSMLVLAKQIRESTGVAKAEGIRAHGERMVDHWYRVAESERLMSAMGPAIFDETSIEEMTEDQRRISYCMIRGLAQFWESEYLEDQTGAIDARIWDSRRNAIVVLLEKPAYNTVWTDLRGVLSPEFVHEIESIRERRAAGG